MNVRRRTQNWKQKRIKAGALQLVIAVALVLFLLIGIFLLRKGLTGHLMAVVQTDEQLQLNLESEMVLLENRDESAAIDSSTFNLFPEFGDSTSYRLKPWGMFDVALISSRIRNQEKRAILLMGRAIGRKEELPSLYFSDPDRYLSVAGFTWLGNNTYLPGFGARKAYINGIGYFRETLVQGTSEKAAAELPELGEKLKARYADCFEDPEMTDASEYFSGNIEGATLKHSFGGNSLLIESTDDINLQGANLSGNIIIKSEGKITLDKTSRLDNCLVVGKSIRIEPGFRGRGQFFAADTLIIGSGSQLLMPTVVAVIDTSEIGFIGMGKDAALYGNIVFSSAGRVFRTGLKIEEACKIIGQVHCCGYADFSGTVFGSFYTKGFVSISERSFNQNLLLNVCIDAERLPDEYAGLNLIDDMAHLKYIERLK